MKLLFIAGLEHSGTTLTDQLLSSHHRVLSLGEIASFLSPDRMTKYMKAWGGYPDVTMCSCGRNWKDCEFWGELIDLNGLHSTLPLKEKYRLLMTNVKRRYGADIVVTDSSKTLVALQALREAWRELGEEQEQMVTVFTVKDVRCFTSSVQRKIKKQDFLSAFRTMNWWTASNKKYMSKLNDTSAGTFINLYEQLCAHPLAQINAILEVVNETPLEKTDLPTFRSHIAMGNKNFLMRNRRDVRYDQKWFLEDTILLCYLLNRKANALNRMIYAASASQRVSSAARQSPDPRRPPGVTSSRG